jgi:hypothetical protein
LIVLKFAGLDIQNSFFGKSPGSAQAELDKPAKNAKNPTEQAKHTKIYIYLDGGENDEKPKPRPKKKPVNLKRINSSLDGSDLEIESSLAKKRKLAINTLDSKKELDDQDFPSFSGGFDLSRFEVSFKFLKNNI